MSELFPVVQIGYWLALATWFGGVLFVAIAAPIIFETVSDADPILPKVLSVNLEGQHSTLLAGTIVSNLLVALRKLELACSAVVMVTIAIQLARQWQPWTPAFIRVALFLAAVVLTFYDWRFVWPQIEKHRQAYIDNADNPEVANPAREQFDKYHNESVTILKIVLGLLLGIIVFSGTISSHGPVTFTVTAKQGS
jgi:hypothetical protein